MIGRILALLAGCAVLLLLARGVAFFCLDPDFSVRVVGNDAAGVELRIEPNFVVNSVYAIQVDRNGERAFSCSQPRRAPILVTVPCSDAGRSALTVRCELQYDRIAPCIASVEHVIDAFQRP